MPSIPTQKEFPQISANKQNMQMATNNQYKMMKIQQRRLKNNSVLVGGGPSSHQMGGNLEQIQGITSGASDLKI